MGTDLRTGAIEQTFGVNIFKYRTRLFIGKHFGEVPFAAGAVYLVSTRPEYGTHDGACSALGTPFLGLGRRRVRNIYFAHNRYALIKESIFPSSTESTLPISCSVR